MNRKPRIQFLFSDTGGGHRSSTEAIIEAIEATYHDAIHTEMTDFLRQYYPWPYNKMPEIYRESVKYPRAYSQLWHRTNGRRRAQMLMDTNRLFPGLFRRHKHLLRERPADLWVITHYMAIPPMLWLPREHRPKTCVIVTDLVSTHSTWFRKEIDMYTVPTAAARDNAIADGIDPRKIHLIGLPVAERFCQSHGTKAQLRAELGWPQDKPMVLVVGGGEGMGPFEENARAIANAGLDLGLVLVTGRNKKLKAQLEAQSWTVPTFVTGFVTNMEKYMQAADVLVTKAGPSTICEGLNAGLPIILYDRLPGQEEGNVTYLIENEAGLYAPHPEQVVAQLRTWLRDPSRLSQAANAARQIARPEAAQQIAQLLVNTVTQPSQAPHYPPSFARPHRRLRL